MILQKNGIDIPSYMDDRFFHDVLKRVVQNSTSVVQKVNFTMGSDGGENYCSFIYRATIDVLVDKNNLQRIHLIIKSIPSTGERYIFEEMKIHKKETDMYFDMIPRIDNLLKMKMAARCYHTQEEPIQTLVFEDLKHLGCRLADRQTGLDEEHCAVLLRKLGKFHAASLYLVEKDPSLMEKYNSGLFNETSLKFKFIEGVFLDNLNATLQVIEQWQGYEKILAKLINIKNDFIRRFGENAKPSANEIKVLNHGDLWVNNFMFKYNTEFSKHPNDVFFIDFQGSYYSSPGIDINYFLNTSVQMDVLKNRRFYILHEYYYKSFRETLEDLNVQSIPTFDDILAEVRRKEFYGFCSAIGVLAIVGMDKESSKDNNIENFADKDVAKQKSAIACSTKRYTEMMQYLLKRFDIIGLFD